MATATENGEQAPASAANEPAQGDAVEEASDEAPSDDSEAEEEEDADYVSPRSHSADVAEVDASPRQRRASALAASKKVSDYIVGANKSIRVLRAEMDPPSRKYKTRGNGTPRGRKPSTAAKPRRTNVKRDTAASEDPSPTLPPPVAAAVDPPLGMPNISVPISLTGGSVGGGLGMPIPLHHLGTSGIVPGHHYPQGPGGSYIANGNDQPSLARRTSARATTAALQQQRNLPTKRRRNEITTAKEGAGNAPVPKRRGQNQWTKKRERERELQMLEEQMLEDSDVELGEEEDLAEEEDEDEEEEMDQLYGCGKCRYAHGGCAQCRETPLFERPKGLRWQPDSGRPQTGIPSAPTFYPTEAEFADPLRYINSIRVEAERCGIACVVPPKGWAPPFSLDKGTNGQHSDSFKFSIRKQLTSHLCTRLANTKTDRKKRAAGRYTSKRPGAEEGEEGADKPDCDGEFGFLTLDKPHTLKSFSSYAKWSKNLHFSEPLPNGAKEREPKRRRTALEEAEPTVEQVEAEFWRIVESPDQVVESLYGQDLDSGQHGSGFPLPPYRQRLLEEHLARVAQAEAQAQADKGLKVKAVEGIKPRVYTPEERAYSEHPWNINNLTRCKGSVLRYLVGEELITGVMVPWLYVGSCMSAFCWHVEDHALYSINYLHQGAPKVWYGVPPEASETLEAAFRDALPHLFEAAPSLLYQLVTMLSPMQLQARGVPVHRLVHEEGSFVITFPNAYHAGFNTGLNCAEAVNFGPPDWLPWGHYVGNKYRKDAKAATLSNDALLINLAKAAPMVQKRLAEEAQARSGAPKEEATEPHVGPHSVYKDATKAVGKAADEAAAMEVDDPPADEEGAVKLELSGGATGALKVQLSVAGQDAAAKREDVKAEPLTDGYVPGRPTDLSYLDPINHADTPALAVQLGTAELVLRIEEERRRRQAGLKHAPGLPSMRMTGTTPAAKDEQGMYTNTEDTDCEQCKCDLYLSAIISPACPGKAACPEHASCLPCPPSTWVLLYRYELAELEEAVAEAKRCIPGTAEAIVAAQSLKAHPAPRPVAKPQGPLVPHLSKGNKPPVAPLNKQGPTKGQQNEDPAAAALLQQGAQIKRRSSYPRAGAAGRGKRKAGRGREAGGARKKVARGPKGAAANGEPLPPEVVMANKAKMARARQAKAEKSVLRRSQPKGQEATANAAAPSASASANGHARPSRGGP
ncbi:hypothetical protein WJX73_000542 [Symbiochloris irregularis]|uniref:Uncharacterized protein n=1 Tax=Symbiochloris irregularis TaxID=706552 RepID=A0AAW1P3L4_9CHLO